MAAAVGLPRPAGRGVRRIAAAAATAVLALGVFALWPPRELPALYAKSDCRVASPESPGGAALTGIEDLAVLPDGDLLASAHDRLGDGPSGIFLIAPTHPDDPARAVEGLPDGARPHGLALSPDGGTLAFVNRTPEGAEILMGTLDGARFEEAQRLSGKLFCRANDLAFAGETLLATLDREACGVSLADLLPGARTGRLLRIDLDGSATVAEDGLSFPNGVAEAGDAVAVAETRASRLRIGERTVALPGGPDNLTPLPDGRLLAALHPSLLRLALRRAGIPVSSPTRIVAVAPDGRVEPLFDDPSGALFSGASVAVLSGNTLFAGAPFDDGLLVCGGGT